MEYSLSVRIDPSGAETGGRVVKGQLDGIKRSAGEAEASVKRFGPAANQNFRQAAAGAQFATTAFNTMRLAIAGIAGMVTALAAGPYLRITDQSKQLNAQLLLVAGSTDKAAAAGARLRDVAEQTRSRFAPTVELYTKIARATDQLGISQDRLMNVTKAISQSYRISGASAEEAANSMRQLAQGLSAGALRGDEFISVMEGAPRLARAIADGMGVTVGQLRKLAADGKLTAETIVKALEGQAGALAAEFGKIPQTSSEAFGRVADSLTRLIAKFDAATGISDGIIAGINGIADAIDFLTEHMDTAIKVVKILGVTMLVAFGPAILASIVGLTRAIAFGLVGAVNALTAAMMRNPLGLLAVAIATVIAAAWQFRDDIKRIFGIDLGAIVKDSANWIISTLATAYDNTLTVWNKLPAAFADMGYQAANNFLEAIKWMAREAISIINGVVAKMNGVIREAAERLGFDRSKVPQITGIDPQNRPGSGPFAPGGFENPYAGSQRAFDEEIARNAARYRNRDWFAGFGTQAGDALGPGMPGASPGVGGVPSADEIARYSKIAQEQAQRSLDEANEAAKAAIDATRAFYKDVFKGMFSDFRQGIQEGKGLWKSFAGGDTSQDARLFDQLETWGAK